MDNLINRKVLLREMTKLYNEREADAYMTGDKEIHVSWNDAVYLITIAPTIEAEPIRHGKWIDCGWSIKCSECGHNMPFSTRNYCPNCGAKMDEIDNET